MLKKSLNFVIGACSLLFMVNHASASQNDWTAYGARPLAMGNAFVSIADDYNALLYNPAGIARLKEWDGELIQATLFVGANTMGSADELVKLGGDPQLSKILEFFESNAGEPQHVGVNITPHLIFKNFGFGLSISSQTTITTHNDIDVEFQSKNEILLPIVYAHNFLGERLSVGATLKPRMLVSIDQSFNAETVSDADNAKDVAKAGAGIGFDAGILFTPVKKMEPTLGISITDIGGTSFKEQGSDGTGKPSSIISSVNTGFSLKPIQSPTQYLSVSVEAHSINQKIHYSKKFHVGAEWGYRSVLKVQTGLKDGYLTGGFQVDVGLLNLAFSTYVEDYGPISGLNDKLVDRRYALKLKLFI